MAKNSKTITSRNMSDEILKGIKKAVNSALRESRTGKFVTKKYKPKAKTK